MTSAITGRRIRFALAGCGRISANHFKALAEHSANAELVAVCDIDPAALARAASETGAQPFASLEAMLDEARPDIVVLSTPSGLHSAQAIVAARRGVHVLTEKPMATHWADGLRMVQACEQAGVRLFVVKQNRHNATLKLLKQTIESGRFGQIYSVAVNVFWARPQSYYDAAAWRGTRDLDGGALMNQASHYIDLLNWLVGPVDSVQAFLATQARRIKVEDSGVMVVRWKSGALGTVNVSMLTYPQNLEGSVTILGERGTVKVGGVAVNEILHWQFADERPEDQGIRSASYETTSVYGHGHPLYYENVIRVLRGEEEPKTDGREGLKSLELLIAAYESEEYRRIVNLPLPRVIEVLNDERVGTTAEVIRRGNR